jgi:hypothetical protein
MKRSLTLASLLLLMAITGCGDTHESLTEDGISTIKKLIAVLDGVKDEASAKSAKSEIKSLMEKLNEINTKQTKLPQPTEAEVKAMGEKHGKEMDELQQKLAGHMMRIGFDPKIGPVLNDIDMKGAH